MSVIVTSDYVIAADQILNFAEAIAIRGPGGVNPTIGSLTNYGVITNTFNNIPGASVSATVGPLHYIRNYGSISVTSPRDQSSVYGIGGADEVYNAGTITVVGFSSSGGGAGRLGAVNVGEIRAFGQGAATGFDVGGSPFRNDGTIEAHTSGGGSTVSWAAALAVWGDAATADPVVNTGTLIASAADPGGQSSGIAYRFWDPGMLSILNSGTITATWAIRQRTESAVSNDSVFNSGTLNGKVDLGLGADILTNSGWINGDIFLGAGGDAYYGASAKSGVTVYGADGDDALVGGAWSDVLCGGAGSDLLTGGAGADTFRDTAAGLNGDTITDLSVGDQIVISDASLGSFSYQLSGSTLTYTGGSLTLQNLPSGMKLVASAVTGGGVMLQLAAASVPGAFNADFNGDGRSDVFWRNDNGWISSWLGQAGGGFLGDSTIGGVVPTDWKVIGVGDFNGDGKSDLFWRNDNATVASWLSQAGGGFIQDAAVGGVVPADWKITGIGDFNGDGKDDIFWRNDSGAITSWLGQGGGGFVGDSTVSGTVPTDWKVVTVGDFNGDGRSDLFWRSDSGGIAVWQGQAGGGFVGTAAVSGTVANTWTLIGAGDFNGDGRSDILWRNDTGEIAGWAGQADGGFAGIPGVSGVVPNDWKIANIGDFNGDGRADILWRNDNGQLASWVGKVGGGFVGDAAVGGTIPTDWWTI